jgi:hypothetical protein
MATSTKPKTSLLGPTIGLVIGLLPLGYSVWISYALNSSSYAVFKVAGTLFTPILIGAGLVIALPSAIILIKRLLQKRRTT